MIRRALAVAHLLSLAVSAASPPVTTAAVLLDNGIDADLFDSQDDTEPVGGAQEEPVSASTQSLGVSVDRSTYVVNEGKGLFELEAVTSVVLNATEAPSMLCGNGIRQADEQCDDGNLVDGDGCSKYCKVEGGYACDLKMVDELGDKCKLCKDDECTIFYFGSSRCLPTTKSNLTNPGFTPPVHERRISGFCQCAGNRCLDIEGPMCREEKDGWVANTQTNVCECGLGYCLMPMAQQVISSPTKYHCQKLSPTMVRNVTTGMCQCAEGSPAIASADPAEARPLKLPACKVYPSTPVRKVAHQGPLYPEFSCMAEPYIKANGTDVCTNCTEDACRMPRAGVSASNRNLGATQGDQFYCVAKKTMEILRMTRAADGGCQCTESECLAPYRDTMKCVPIQGSHPYGVTKLTDGKCGCADDASACIMPTTPGGFGKATQGFVCLRLKEGTVPTKYGEKYYRGRKGFCRCLPTRCRADPTPSSVGTFRCVDVESQGAYKLNEAAVAAIKAGTSNEEDVPCACADGSCMLPGDKRNIARCVTCPTAPGDCIGKCSSDQSASVDIVSCIKYCSTKHVKLSPAVSMGYGSMFQTEKFAARVVRCFVSKTITCETQADKSKVCTQKITARAMFDCPGEYSLRGNRKLVNGVETFGFKSQCSEQNYLCQKEKCNVEANPAVCLQSMLIS